MDSILIALQASDLATLMRQSTFLTPFLSVLHLLATLGFFAAVAAMNARLLSNPVIDEARDLLGRIRPIAITCFLTQISTGLAIIAPDAASFAQNQMFRLKVIAIALALANILMVEISIGTSERISGAARAALIISLGTWIAAATAGQLMAFF